MNSASLDPALDALVRADLRRARNRTGLGCWTLFLGLGTLASLGLGGYLVYGALRYDYQSEAIEYALLFGAISAVLLAATAAAWWKARQVRSALHDAAVSRRAEVVWVYPKQMTVDLVAYYGGHNVGREQHARLVIAFADATSIEVVMESMVELAGAEAVLKRWLPQAQHGYSSELSQQYAAAPASLRRS